LTELDVVTGAYSYTGRHIAEELLVRGRRVRTLARRPAPSGHPLGGRIDAVQLRFDPSLVENLRGADTLYNTYWVRFEHGSVTFDSAVEHTLALFRAARDAGVRRIVHVSVSNPSDTSPFAYFRGKARCERGLGELGISHAIVRPTLVFGPEDILLNNIAWILRRFPLFLVPGDGRYPVQPVSVRDTAAIAVDAGARDDDVVVDAAGPQRLSFVELVRLVAEVVGARARVRPGSARLALALARVAGAMLRDVVLTRDELDGLMAGLLVSSEPPLGRDRVDSWLTENAQTLGRTYVSELGRNFRGQV
jgi:uncharacterized protein YbjT (DUF2867 family)